MAPSVAEHLGAGTTHRLGSMGGTLRRASSACSPTRRGCASSASSGRAPTVARSSAASPTELGLRQPTVSHHVKALHDEGVLERSPRGPAGLVLDRPVRRRSGATSCCRRMPRAHAPDRGARARGIRPRRPLRGRVLARDGRAATCARATTCSPSARASPGYLPSRTAAFAAERLDALASEQAPRTQAHARGAVRLRAERRALAARGGDPAAARRRPRARAHRGLGAGERGAIDDRRRARRDRRADRRRVPEAAHRRGGAGGRRRGHDGLRRRLPRLSRAAATSTGSSRTRPACRSRACATSATTSRRRVRGRCSSDLAAERCVNRASLRRIACAGNR